MASGISEKWMEYGVEEGRTVTLPRHRRPRRDRLGYVHPAVGVVERLDLYCPVSTDESGIRRNVAMPNVCAVWVQLQVLDDFALEFEWECSLGTWFGCWFVRSSYFKADVLTEPRQASDTEIWIKRQVGWSPFSLQTRVGWTPFGTALVPYLSELP